MAFRRKPKAEDPEHPKPVEINLGSLMPWQADVVLADMEQRFHMKSVKFNGMPHGGPAETSYTVLVHADDEAEVRAELIEAELLQD